MGGRSLLDMHPSSFFFPFSPCIYQVYLSCIEIPWHDSCCCSRWTTRRIMQVLFKGSVALGALSPLVEEGLVWASQRY